MITVSTLAAIFFFLWQKAEREIEQRVAQEQSFIGTIEAQNEWMKVENIARYGEMKEEIMEEILNQGKRDNEGLLDTLPAIRTRTKQLLEEEQLSYQALSQWQQELIDMVKPLRGDSYFDTWMEEDEPFALSLTENRTPSQSRAMLLNWEKNIYWSFMTRLGSTRCWAGDRISQVLIPTQHLVMADSIFIARLWEGVGDHYTFQFLSTAIPKEAPTSSLGKVEKIPGRNAYQLLINTKGLLDEEEIMRTIPFEIETRFPTPTGGYWTYSTQHSLTVIRPMDN